MYQAVIAAPNGWDMKASRRLYDRMHSVRDDLHARRRLHTDRPRLMAQRSSRSAGDEPGDANMKLREPVGWSLAAAVSVAGIIGALVCEPRLGAGIVLLAACVAGGLLWLVRLNPDA